MNRKQYIPSPIDTSNIEVPPELSALGETLARNVHEVWAKEKLSQGWIYGEKLDHEKKTHPDLIPYDELSESIRDFDRNTSMETIKLLLSFGYKIIPKDSE